MRRRLVLLTALVPLVLPASAAAAAGTYYPGDPIDGPGPDVQSLQGLSVARDGTGALVYLRKDGGVDHVFVSRLVDGAFAPGERVDAGLDNAATQAAVSTGNGGKIVIAFVNGGALYTSYKADATQGFGGAQLISTPGINPSVATSINGTSYVAYTSGGDVNVARLDRKAATFAGVPGPLDIDATRDAGDGNGRPRIAVAADGVATVVWGEAGSTFARRVFESRLSSAPQTIADGSDLPDISTEDDSSYAWVVARQSIDGQQRGIARRLVGSEFDPAVGIDGGEPVNAPDVEISGKGVGYAAMGSSASAGAFGAVLKDDKFSPATLLGGFGGPSFPDVATADNGDGLIAFEQTDNGTRQVHGRPYDYVATTRAVTQPGPDVTLSRPDLGNTDASRGLLAAADRAGDIVTAFIQGDTGSRAIVAGTFDRAPGTFVGYTSTKKYVTGPRPTLKWGTSFELWGPLTYTVFIDGKPNGQTNGTSLQVPNPVLDGVHTWRVVATDRRGQATASPVRNLRVDGRPPKATFKVSRSGRVVKVTVKASDVRSGVGRVRIDFGDRSAVNRRAAIHRYGRGGKFTVTVGVSDKAGNLVVLKRRITVK